MSRIPRYRYYFGFSKILFSLARVQAEWMHHMSGWIKSISVLEEILKDLVTKVNHLTTTGPPGDQVLVFEPTFVTSRTEINRQIQRYKRQNRAQR